MDKVTRQNLVGGLLIIAALAIVIYAVQPYLPELVLPPEIPGNLPVKTIQTEVKITLNALGGDPNIDYIYSTEVGAAIASTEEAKIMLFPWQGTLKIEVIAPDGVTVSMSKEVKVELGHSQIYYFTWKTRQSGTHIVIATLINGDGVVVGQKQEEVWIG